MKGFHGKVESDKKRDCKITILVSRSDRDRIIKAARADGDRTVSDIGMEYLLKYAEMVENREGVKVNSTPNTERVQREIPPYPSEEMPIMPYADVGLNRTDDGEESTEMDTEPEKSKEAVKEPITDTKATGPVEVPVEEEKPVKPVIHDKPKGFTKNGIKSVFSEEDVERAKEILIDAIEKHPRKEINLWDVIMEHKDMQGGMFGDAIEMNPDIFTIGRDDRVKFKKNRKKE